MTKLIKWEQNSFGEWCLSVRGKQTKISWVSPSGATWWMIWIGRSVWGIRRDQILWHVRVFGLTYYWRFGEIKRRHDYDQREGGGK